MRVASGVVQIGVPVSAINMAVLSEPICELIRSVHGVPAGVEGAVSTHFSLLCPHAQSHNTSTCRKQLTRYQWPTMVNQSIQGQLDSNRRKVDVDYYDLTLREIVRMAAEGELKTAPEYQRKFRWQPADESRLIESLFLGLPVPSIFVATNIDGSWEVVDGLQRVSTLLHFVFPEGAGARIGRPEPLRIEELTILTEFNGRTYEDLGTPLQLGFNKRLMRVTALSDKSDPNIRFDMFERLNTGGIALTHQEVRACIFRGDFIRLLDKLAEEDEFQSLLRLPANKKSDGTAAELVLKTLAYRYDRNNFKGQVKAFLNDFAKEGGDAHDHDALALSFRRAVHELVQVVPGHISRRNVNSTPLNLAEALLAAAVELVDEDSGGFAPVGDWLNDELLSRYSRAGSNNPAFLKGRIERAKALLRGAEPVLAPDPAAPSDLGTVLDQA